ncbi:hypothetical protein BW686_16905 [Pseudomonas syringae]|uniref:Uncharacterized protein n=1 Tax=Pseudomonas syringae TaxID=317 RepID=A0A244EPB1_PSESX|nr:hypothetical protein BW686_16905 [Pseudomonas syringae]
MTGMNFNILSICLKNKELGKQPDANSDFSQNFFISGWFEHACCFITHMITAPLAENRGDRIKGKRLGPQSAVKILKG